MHACVRIVMQDVLGFSIAIHHAGLPKADRALVEDLYLAKQIQVTLSLSHGMRPAKDTDIYIYIYYMSIVPFWRKRYGSLCA